MTTPEPTPIPMLLWCPVCHRRHVDEGVFETKPHRDHSCQNCGLTWRPALVPTVGVRFLPGYKNAEENELEIASRLAIWFQARRRMGRTKFAVVTAPKSPDPGSDHWQSIWLRTISEESERVLDNEVAGLALDVVRIIHTDQMGLGGPDLVYEVRDFLLTGGWEDLSKFTCNTVYPFEDVV